MGANYAALVLSAFFFGLLERFPPFGSSWTWSRCGTVQFWPDVSSCQM